MQIELRAHNSRCGIGEGANKAELNLTTKVLYLNGGHPTWGALDYVKLLAIALCSFSPHRAVAAVCRFIQCSTSFHLALHL